MSWYQSDIQKEAIEYVPPSWSTGTDAEIVEALQKHYSGEIDICAYWSVGDEREIILDAMPATGVGESHVQQTVTFVLSHAGGKYLSDGITQCAFQVDQKYCLNDSEVVEAGYINSTSTNSNGWYGSDRRTWCNTVYRNAIPSTIRGIFKEFINKSGRGSGTPFGLLTTNDYFALRAEIEVLGKTNGSFAGEGSQVLLYKTSSNAAKSFGNPNGWWTRSAQISSENAFRYIQVNAYGNPVSSSTLANHSYSGIAPFGVI